MNDTSTENQHAIATVSTEHDNRAQEQVAPRESVVRERAHRSSQPQVHRRQSFVPHQLAERRRVERPRSKFVFKGDCVVHHLQTERARVQKEQYTAAASKRLARIQKQQYKYRWVRTKIAVQDAEGERIYVGDKVKALTQGRSHTDLGIVNKFSKDGSRVFFLDFRGVEQQRAPENVIIVA